MASFALPLIGDAVSAGLSLFGGKGAAGTDRANELDAYDKLKSTSDQQLQNGGLDSGAASRYYQALLSGDPAAIARATAPVANAGAAQANQQRQVLGNQGGDRSGGTNATTQQITTNANAGTMDAVAKAQNGAAAPLAQMGSDETGKGLTATSDLGTLAEGSRETSSKIAQEQGSALGAFTSSPEAAKFAKSVSGFLLGKNGSSGGSGNTGTFGAAAPFFVG